MEAKEAKVNTVKFQNEMHRLDTAIELCIGCQENWHKQRSLDSWYSHFTNWVSIGSCSVVTAAVIPGQKIVLPEDEFYDCLQEWFLTDFGRNKKKDIVMTDGRIEGWREFVTPLKTQNMYEDGRTYLENMRRVLGTYGLGESYAFSKDMLLMEMFVVIV